MKIIYIILVLLINLTSYSQTYNMSNSTVNTCGGTFYDTGGPENSYSSEESLSMTFCSDQEGAEINLDFTSFDLESATYDNINIYDGIGTDGTQLVANAGNNTLSGQAIQSQGSGCLTVVFKSDESIEYSGWEAEISCIFPCQYFTADIVNTSEPYYNGDTIRLCQNTPLTLTAAGTYPNDTNYTQDDATSIFHWNFGDGTDTSGVELTTVNHNFSEGGYNIILDVTDQNNCTNSNLARVVLMVSTSPNFNGTNITDTICPGESISFTGTTNTNIWEQQIPLVVGLQQFIDDNQGVEFTTTITNNFFPFGSTVNDSSDIQDICMEFEHSYMGDLEIWITCPNGQSMHLLDYLNNGSSTFLGEPIALHLPVDANTDNTTPGVGYNYCFSPTATNGTIDNSNNWTHLNSYTDGIGQYSDGSTDGDGSADGVYQLPAGTYEAVGVWSDLIGCPLNGDWTMHFEDHNQFDNGYVFSWKINWDTSLTSNLWSFENTYDSSLYSWSGQNITSQANGSGIAVPTTTGGTEYYTFTATDDFGCSYDTLLPIYIYQTNNPICCVGPFPEAGQNDSICGLSIQLNAIYDDNTNNGLWTVTGPGNIIFDDATLDTTTVTADTYGEYTFTWTELAPTGCQASDTLIIKFNPNPNISINIDSTLCFGSSDGSLTIIHNTTTDSPYTYIWDNGQTTITNSNVNIGTYNTTVTNIHGCTSSISGTVFQPTQLSATTSSTSLLCFNDSNGSATVNVSNGTPSYTYLWSDETAQTNATANNLSAGSYNVTITDANGCTLTKNVIITEPTQIISTYSTTSLGCVGATNGNINLTVSGGTPDYYYLWNTGDTTQNLQNVGLGSYSVTITDENSCIFNHNNIVISEPDPIVVSITGESTICLTNSKDLVCSALGGTPPYTYIWNNGDTTSIITVTPNDTTNYSVIITDANGCTSNTSETTVNVLPPITGNAVGDNDKICPGATLTITINPQGGNGNYIYTLQDGQNVTQNFTVYPNDTTSYIITISDDCGSPTDTAQVTVSIIDIPALSFSADITQGCQPLAVTFTEQSDDEEQIFSWDFGDNNLSNIGSTKQPIHIYQNSGTYDVTLKAISTEGCTTTLQLYDLINVFKNPEAKFITNPSDANIIKPEIKFNNLSIGATNYYWNFGDGSTFIGAEPIHNYPNISNNYTVTLISESDKRCRDTTYSTVYIYDVTTLYAPNAFSPDGDGINDKWNIIGTGIDLDNVKIQVYDRWGEVIYETSDLTIGWDGTIKNNKLAPAGIYYWIITYRDVSGIGYEQSGTITLIK